MIFVHFAAFLKGIAVTLLGGFVAELLLRFLFLSFLPLLCQTLLFFALL